MDLYVSYAVRGQSQDLTIGAFIFRGCGMPATLEDIALMEQKIMDNNPMMPVVPTIIGWFALPGRAVIVKGDVTDDAVEAAIRNLDVAIGTIASDGERAPGPAAGGAGIAAGPSAARRFADGEAEPRGARPVSQDPSVPGRRRSWVDRLVPWLRHRPHPAALRRR